MNEPRNELLVFQSTYSSSLYKSEVKQFTMCSSVVSAAAAATADDFLLTPWTAHDGVPIWTCCSRKRQKGLNICNKLKFGAPYWSRQMATYRVMCVQHVVGSPLSTRSQAERPVLAATLAEEAADQQQAEEEAHRCHPEVREGTAARLSVSRCRCSSSERLPLDGMRLRRRI